MTWTAEIKGKELAGGVLKVSVDFTNGTDTVSDSIDMTGGSLDVLARKVKGKITTLEATEALAASIEVGAYSPVVVVEDAQKTAFLASVRDFERCKRAVELGLIKVEDAAYTDALAAMKAAAVDATLINAL